MLKIFVVCIIIGAVTSRPSYVPTAVSIPSYGHYAYEPSIVGHAVTHLPSAVSHQSQTIVHEKRPYFRPIVGYKPAAAYVRAHYTPTHHTKLLSPATFGYAPISYATDLYPTSWHNGLAYTNGWNGWPLK